MTGLAVLTLTLILFSVYGSDVIELTDANFNDVVLKSELPFMVEFIAPWCGHCKALIPEWEKAAANLKDLLQIGKVDCTAHQAICSKYDVKGYPTIKCFSEKGKNVVDYQQARQASAIVRFATEQIPDRIARVKDEAALEKFLEKNPERPHVLLFSSKPEVSPLVKSLAVKFGSKLLCGQAKKGVKELEEKYNVQSFPTILAITGENIVTFDGAVSSQALGAWLAGLVGEEVDAAPEAEPEEPKPKPKPRPTKVVEKAFSEVDPGSIADTCSTTLCVVGVVDAEGEDTRVVKAAHKPVLDNVVEKWHRDGKFKFVWVDRSKAAELVQKFSLPTDGPTMFVYNAKRSKFALADSFDESATHRLLEHVNAGDVKYQQLKVDSQ